MKRITPILIAVICVLMLLTPITSSAAIDAELSNLTVIMEFGEEKLSGINVAVCRVADATEVENALVFDATAEFLSAGADFTEMTEAKNVELAALLDAYAVANNITRTQELTDQQGIAQFRDLPVGLYLVAQTDLANSEYIIAPYLVMIPLFQPTVGWEHDVVTYPKSEPVKRAPKVISVHKLWAGTQNHPTSIVVQLYRNNQPHGDAVTLNAANHWSQTWEELSPIYTWTVDELNVPAGFSKSISGSESTGFVITNTKIPTVPDIPNTSDDSNMQLWVTLMIVGSIGLLVVLCVLNSERLSRTFKRK